MKTVNDIRKHFADELKNENFTIDRNGNKTLELLGASFIADEEFIFGKPSKSYIDAEIKWYESQSTNINTLSEIYGKTPVAWKMTANKHGEINSNYGAIIFSEKYYNQYLHVLIELISNPFSRRAQLIYNRPSIWKEFNENGKNDFICTNAQTFYIRDNKLNMVSQMRSNDCWAGYRNDYAWAKYVMSKMITDYNDMTRSDIEPGNIYWQVMNLHVYENQFYLVDYYRKTQKTSISLEDYKKLYPDSTY